MRQGLDSLTFGERRELMRLLVEDVTCGREKVTIRTIVPLDRELAWRRTLSLAVRPLTVGAGFTRAFCSRCGTGR